MDHRGPRHQVRRRGRGAPRRDARGHLHPGGQPGAARARALPARRGRPAARRPHAEREPNNRLHDWLLDADERRAARATDLTDALVSFDAATIATIHQFCQLVLRSLGVAGDTDASATLVEDLEQLTTEIVDDLYLARFGGERDAAVVARRGPGARPGGRRRPARRGRAAPGRLAESPDSAAAMRVRFAPDVLDEVERPQAPAGRPQLRRPAGPAGRRPRRRRRPRPRPRMRHRWKVVLIDEFQDTDPVQWQVFERAFSDATTMVLIGDPKQAIYAFRGGDIVTYLQAAEYREHHADPGRQLPLRPAAARRGSRRCSEARQLGDERIVVHPVEASLPSPGSSGAGDPFRLRVVRRAELGARIRGPGRRRRGGATTSSPTSPTTSSGCSIRSHLRRVALVPGDVAVLAARRTELEAVQQALADLGCPVGHQRRRLRLPHARRDRVAHPPRGPRAAAPHRPGPRGRPHVLLRLLRRVARRRRRRRDRPARRAGSAPWPTSSPRGEWPPSSRRRWSRASPPGCSAGSAASAP